MTTNIIRNGGVASASVVGAINDAAASGAVTDSDTQMAYIKQLVTESVARDLVITGLEEGIEEIEGHIHAKTRWMGKKAVQSATEWGVPTASGLTLLYRAKSGDGVYGVDANDEAQILGTADVVLTGALFLDPHELLVIANTSDTLYLLRLVWGSGTLANAVTAGQYTEIPYIRKATDTVRRTSVVVCPRIAAGSKVWVQAMNVTDNATIDFIIGFHTYAA